MFPTVLAEKTIPTLLEWMGGMAALERLFEIFYAKVSAHDEANGQHGRAAREVGRRAAGMRCSSAITAA